MLFVYIGLYALFLVIIWGFYIVARIHAFKFKDFSSNIKRNTNILLIFLLILSLIGGYIIISYATGTSNVTIDVKKNNVNDVYY